MALSGVPWFIGHGGAIHPPEIQRLLAYVAAGGSEGIVNAGDMAVTATGTPDGHVHVAAGGAVLLNRSAGATSQAYVQRNDADVAVTVPPTSGSARSDLLVLRIKDDQYSPWSAPGDPVNGPYSDYFLVPNVASTVRTAAELALGYTAIELALITQPSGNSAVTNAMILNLGNIATPRSKRFIYVTNPGAVQSLTSIAADGVAFPTASGAWTIDVPSWAQSAFMRADWALGAPAGNVFGALWARIGLLAGTHVDMAAVGYNTPGATNLSRYPMFAADKVTVPVGLRGVRGVALSMRGNVSAAPGAAAIQVDTGGPCILDIEFRETA